MILAVSFCFSPPATIICCSRTIQYSNDTIWLLSTMLLLVHLFFLDYSSGANAAPLALPSPTVAASTFKTINDSRGSGGSGSSNTSNSTDGCGSSTVSSAVPSPHTSPHFALSALPSQQQQQQQQHTVLSVAASSAPVQPPALLGPATSALTAASAGPLRRVRCGGSGSGAAAAAAGWGWVEVAGWLRCGVSCCWCWCCGHCVW